MKTSVESFITNYADALTTFSAENISGFYQTPLAVYSDQGVQLVENMSEVLAFWESGIEPYKALDIEKAMPRILNEEQLSKTIYTAKVLWNNFNSAGKEVSSETNFYILSQNESGLKISGLIIITKK